MVYTTVFRNAWDLSYDQNSDLAFNIDKMTELLDHDNLEMRKKFRDFMSDPVMTPKYDISLAEERDIALKRLKRICDVSKLIEYRLTICKVFFKAVVTN